MLTVDMLYKVVQNCWVKIQSPNTESEAATSETYMKKSDPVVIWKIII